MKKRLTAILLMLAFFTTSALAASTYQKSIEVEYGITLSINGKTPTLADANGSPVQPFVYDGTTYVPIRAVSTNLGAAISYDSKNNAANITTSASTASTSDNIAKTDIQILKLWKDIEHVANSYNMVQNDFFSVTGGINNYFDYTYEYSIVKEFLPVIKDSVARLKSQAAALSSAMPQGMYEEISQSFVILEDCAKTSDRCVDLLDAFARDPQSQKAFDDLLPAIVSLGEITVSVQDKAYYGFNTWYETLIA